MVVFVCISRILSLSLSASSAAALSLSLCARTHTTRKMSALLCSVLFFMKKDVCFVLQFCVKKMQKVVFFLKKKISFPLPLCSPPRKKKSFQR